MLIRSTLNLFHNPIVGCNQWFDRQWAGWSLNSLGTVRGELACILASSQYWNQDGPMSCNPKGVWRQKGWVWTLSSSSRGVSGCGLCTHSASALDGHPGGTQRWGSYTGQWAGGTLCSPPCTWQSTTCKRDSSFSTISAAVTSPTLSIIALRGILSYAESRNPIPSLLASIRLRVSSKWLFPVT